MGKCNDLVTGELRSVRTYERRREAGQLGRGKGTRRKQEESRGWEIKRRSLTGLVSALSDWNPTLATRLQSPFGDSGDLLAVTAVVASGWLNV